jgi:hypothetical protein
MTPLLAHLQSYHVDDGYRCAAAWPGGKPALSPEHAQPHELDRCGRTTTTMTRRRRRKRTVVSRCASATVVSARFDVSAAAAHRYRYHYRDRYCHRF